MTASKKRAFAVAAHPDDIEFVMAGTLILLAQAGYEIHYMNIANGCCGSSEFSAEHTAVAREKEAIAAADSIGAEFHPSLVNDLEIFYNDETLKQLAAVMREVSPEILLVHSPSDYMEDHMNACRLAVTAAFARGMPNYPTIPPRPPVEQTVTIYHAQPHGNRDPLGADGSAQLVCRRGRGHGRKGGDAGLSREPAAMARHEPGLELLHRNDARLDARGGRHVRSFRICRRLAAAHASGVVRGGCRSACESPVKTCVYQPLTAPALGARFA